MKITHRPSRHIMENLEIREGSEGKDRFLTFNQCPVITAESNIRVNHKSQVTMQFTVPVNCKLLDA